MFGKTKDTTEKPTPAKGPDGDPWDQKTLEWLKGTKMLDLHLTNVERRFKSGPSAPAREVEYMPELIVSGYLPHAGQHVHLRLEFKPMPGYGNAWLTYQLGESHPAGKLNVPYLAIHLSDADGVIRNGIVEAMRDTIAAGLSVVEARIWPIIPENWEEKPGGHSRTFDIGGMIVWANSRSPRLSTWALEIGGAEFATHPNPGQLRLKPDA